LYFREKKTLRIFLSLSLCTLLFAACQHQNSLKIDPWADYRKAYALLNTNKDSAYFYFNQSASRSSVKQVIALAYYNMALIQTDGGDYYGAQESLTQSLRSLDESRQQDWSDLATDYNELGMTSTRLGNYKQAIQYYQLALHYDRNNTVNRYTLNNRGNAHKMLKEYSKAISSYQASMQISGTGNSDYARALTNLATVQWLRDPRYNPLPGFMQALAIRKQKKDRWGENSSYAQLSDYYLKSQPDSARSYALQMLAIARELQSPDDELEALQKLIMLSPADAVKPYFSRYQRVNDSVEKQRNASKSQFALIRYNVEKDKAENLRLQKGYTERNYQLAGALLILIAGAFFTIVWLKKRKERQEREKKEAVLETERRAAKKVHDTLANDVYRIMKEVQHANPMNRKQLADDIGDLYLRTRDISYEIITDTREPAQERMSRLILAFGTETTKVSLVGNDETFWQKVDPAVQFELKYILQELMVNMHKHSQATNVTIRFELKGNHCTITYLDNGIGLPENLPEQNGLSNTGNRIKAINGEITFDSKTGEGLQIELSFPTL
jgi:signal transduction histidine kinase